MSGKIFLAFLIFGMILHQSNGCFGSGGSGGPDCKPPDCGGPGAAGAREAVMDSNGRSFQKSFNYYLKPRQRLNLRQSESKKFFSAKLKASDRSRFSIFVLSFALGNLKQFV